MVRPLCIGQEGRTIIPSRTGHFGIASKMLVRRAKPYRRRRKCTLFGPMRRFDSGNRYRRGSKTCAKNTWRGAGDGRSKYLCANHHHRRRVFLQIPLTAWLEVAGSSNEKSFRRCYSQGHQTTATSTWDSVFDTRRTGTAVPDWRQRRGDEDASRCQGQATKCCRRISQGMLASSVYMIS
jgi:hypothetical protein